MFAALRRFLQAGTREQALGQRCVELGLLNECPVCRELTDAQPDAATWQAAALACEQGSVPGVEAVVCLDALKQKVADAPLQCVCEQG